MTSPTGQVGSGQEGRPQIGGIHWEGWMQPFNPSTSWSLTAWRVETCFVFPGREGVEDRSEARVDRNFEDKDRWLKKHVWKSEVVLKCNFIQNFNTYMSHITKLETFPGRFHLHGLEGPRCNRTQANQWNDLRLLLYAQDVRLAADFKGIAVKDTVAEVTVQSLWPEFWWTKSGTV